MGLSMDSKSISKELHSLGFNQSVLAEAIGCSPSLVNKVINRKAVSLRIAEAISKVIGQPRTKVFPELGDRKVIPESRQAQVNRLKEILCDEM